MERRSTIIFKEDGALAHRSAATQNMVPGVFSHLLEEENRPGNSPGPKQFEELWRIMQKELEKKKPSTNLQQLEKELKRTWPASARILS